MEKNDIDKLIESILKTQATSPKNGEAVMEVEAAYLDTKKEDYDEVIKRLESEKFKDDNDGRKAVKDWVITVSSVWMFLVLMIIISVGQHRLQLSDSVLITIITTTTANVLGLMYIVANYLFNKNKST